MPVFVEQRPMTGEQEAYFSRVLRDDPEAQASLLAHLEDGTGEIWAGIFNGSPVAMALVSAAPARLAQLVVHPATRCRGVGTEVLRLLAREKPGLELPPALAQLAARAGLSGNQGTSE